MYGKKILNILLFFGVFFISNTQAQNAWCGTHKTNIDSQNLGEKLAFEAYYQSKLAQNSNAQKRAIKYIIPVVFHIIHEGGAENVSDGAIKGLLEQVNQDFSLTNKDTTRIRPIFKNLAADCEIEFRLAKTDPSGNCTNGITRTFSGLTNNVRDYGGNNVKALIRWNNKKYLNIWLVKSIQSSGEGTVTLGYAYYPGGNSQTDGIVLRYDQMNGNSLTHEIGHYLNLIHTFENGCFAGDNVGDTPPAAEANFGCPKDRNSCSNDGAIDYIDQIENYMDYSDCSAMFTIGQKIRMHSAIEFYRSELVSESNLKATGVHQDVALSSPIASFSAARRVVCIGENIEFTNTSCNYDPNAKFNWEITGKQTLSSNQENPTFSFDSAGLYAVKLTVTNAKGNNSINYANYIAVRESEGELLSPYSNSFNGEFDIPGSWQYENVDNTMRWALNTNGLDASKCLYINNFSNGKPAYKSAFILPGIDISENEDPFLRFNLAYAKIDDTSFDILQILVSIDCGKTWRLVRSDVSSRLATTTNRSTAFAPKSNSEWTEMETDISRYKSFKNLLIKIEFIAGGGNNIYLDNLRIGTSEVGFENALSPIAYKIFPNPSLGGNTLNIEGPSYEKMEHISFLDLAGRIHFESKLEGFNTSISIENLQKGVYLAIISTNKGKVVKRVIIN